MAVACLVAALVLLAVRDASAQSLVAIRVTPPDRSIEIGESKSMTATATFSDGSESEVTDQVLWSSTDPSVASVSNEPGSRGYATAHGRGISFISATLFGVSSSNTGGDGRIRVRAGLVSIRIEPREVSLAEGFTVALRARGLFTDGSEDDITNDVQWESSDRSGISVSNDRGTEGEVTAHDRGSAIITAFDDTGLSSTDSGGDAVVTVAGAVHHLEITPAEEALRVGGSRRFSVRAVLEDASSFSVLRHHVEWSLSDDRVASVSNDPSSAGRVTADAPGTATLSVSHAATRLTAEATVRVVGELVALRVTPPDRRIDLGDTKSMTAIGTFEGGVEAEVTDDVTWRSTNPGVVFVSNQDGQHGHATAVQPGIAFIWARMDGVTSSDTDGDGRVRVPARLEAIRIVPQELTLPADFSRTLEALGTFSDGTVEDVSDEVVWTSSKPTVASVSNTLGSEGEVTSHAKGTTVISVFDPDTGLSSRQSRGDAEVQVDGRMVGLSVRPLEQVLPVGASQRFSVDGELDDGSTVSVSRTDVVWESSDPSVARVGNEPNTAGLVTGAGLGEALISVRHVSSDITSTDSESDALIVVPGTIESLTIHIDDEERPDGDGPLIVPLITGQTVQLAAEAVFTDGSMGDVSRIVDWSSSNSTVASVTTESGRRGLVTARAEGDATISARDPFSGVVSSGDDGATIEVRQLLSLVVTPPDRRIDLGQERSMTATGTLSGGTERELTDLVVWSSSDPSVVEVSNDRGRRGKALAKGPGTAFISAVSPGGLSSSTTDGDARVRVPAELLSIRVTPSTLRLPVGFASELEAEGTFSDGSVSDVSRDVEWTTSAPAVVTVSNTDGTEGEIAALASGTAAISVRDPETGITSAVSGGDARVEVAGRVVGIEVTPREAEIPVGLTRKFSARVRLDDDSTFGLSRRSLQWVTRNSTIATVSSSPGTEGTVQAVEKGETFVSVLHPETGMRSSETNGDAHVIVPGRLMALEVRPQEREVFVGQTKRFSTFGLLEEGGEVKISTDVQFSSEDTAIATVTNDSGMRGNTTGIAEGETSISVVHLPSGLSSADTGGDASVIVEGKVVSLRVEPKRQFFLRGTEERLSLVTVLDNGRETTISTDAVWTSSDPEIAEVGNESPKKGVLTAKAFGTVTISAVEPASGTTTTESDGDGTVTVVDDVQRLRVLDTDLELRTGDRPRLRAVGQFINPAPLVGESEIANIDLTNRVEFTSSDPSVIRIEDGRALAVGLGEAVISAVDGELGITSTGTGGDTVYRVTSALRSLKLKPKKIRLRVGQKRPRAFIAIGRYSDGSRIDLTDHVEFTSSSPDVAQVTSTAGDRGRVLPVTRGKSFVTAVEPVTGFQSTKRRKIIVKNAKR